MELSSDTISNALDEKSLKRALVIINPVAGDGRSLNVLPELIKKLTEKGYLCTTITTTGIGAATKFVKLLGRSSDIVVCSGGDGTANEIISGLMQIEASKRPKFGYIPSGSTNDFAATLGIPKRTKDAIAMIEDGVSVPIDVGRFNDRYYAYVCAFGAFTSIAYSTSQTAKNIFGVGAYIAKGIELIKDISPIHARFIINGEEIEDDFAFCCISNSNVIGGVIRLKSGLVELNDGMFEIILIKYPNDAMSLTKILNAIASGEMSCEHIRIYRASSVDVTILEDEPIDWSLDGEIERGVRHAHIENIHSGIHALINPDNKQGASIRADQQ